ncbi:hypothetical protein BLBBGE_020 [Blattabacterium sp. (Blattella germanica) str. Bge]|uniref:DUF192 domain-containing protein n=1 Tax=Blattabacterium sp. (Blattella germanica) TaxID=624186 RepID=UPI0001BB62B9|nr:DUF192 domain-containing protein [Blattabacterium sp. (Blattella germanica)]ACY40057.1 hypothetical protein BLBBGE_020 [Blattabacterium sp. (Blattella germanica) str. Bge]
MKKMNVIFPIILFFLILFSSSDSEKNDFHFVLDSDIGNLLEIKFIKHGELYMKNKNSILKKIDIELAYSDTEKRNGLKYRSFLKENRGMLFLLKDQEEYKKMDMKNMRIPLDIIYINQFDTIIFVNKCVSPMRELEIIDLPSTIKYILEINAGMSDKWKIKEGITKITWFLNEKNEN